ncbi:MAG: M28 family peptidase [Actinobacteria bacterium]|nr:M28 family peptidase [Actinomycetota bacterium]
MSKIKEHIIKLSYDIGQRKAASGQERLAADYIYNFLDSLNLKVEKVEFSSFPDQNIVWLLLLCLFLISGLAYLREPYAGFLISVVALISFAAENSGNPIVSKIMKRGYSQNIIASIKGKLGRKDIVLLANYDSSIPNIIFESRIKKYFGLIFKLLSFSMVIVTLLYGLSALLIFRRIYWLYRPLHWISFIFLAYILFIAIITAADLLRKEQSPGANNNASGVAVLMELVGYFSKDQPENLNLTFLFTGAKECSSSGIINFIPKNRGDFEDKMFINITAVGAGRIAFTSAEGNIFKYQCSQELQDIASQASKFIGLEELEPVKYQGPNTDCMIILSSNLKGISILGLEDGYPANIYSRRDSVTNIDDEVMLKSFSLIKEMIILLDDRVSLKQKDLIISTIDEQA